MCSCKTKIQHIFYSENQTLFAFEDQTVFYYRNSFHLPARFNFKDSLICGSSLNLYCYDINRNSYIDCYRIKRDEKKGFSLSSSDSCFNNYSFIHGKYFRCITEQEANIKWDSIVIKYEDFDSARYIIDNSQGNYKANGHPLSINEEVFFIVKMKFNLIQSVSTNENRIDLMIYENGEVIAQTKGNLIIPIFTSIFNNLEKNSLER